MTTDDDYYEYEVTGTAPGYPPYKWCPTTRGWEIEKLETTIAVLRGRLDDVKVRRRKVVVFEWEDVK